MRYRQVSRECAFAGNRAAYACDMRAKTTRRLCAGEDNSLAITTVFLTGYYQKNDPLHDSANEMAWALSKDLD